MMISRKNTSLLIVLAAVTVAFICLGLFMHKEKEIMLNLDGKVIPVLTRSITAEAVLKEQGVSWQERDDVDPLPGEMIKPGDTIRVSRCVPVEIKADGNIFRLEHTSADASELCIMAGITLGSLDRVEGIVDKTSLPVKLSVIRVQEIYLDIEEKVIYPCQKTLDPNSAKGRQVIVQSGEDGLTRKRYLVRYENGVEMMRRELTTIVIKEPKPEIIILGTKGTLMISSRSSVNPKKTLQVEATAYTHTGNTTFTGVYPRVGTIAVDPAVIPLGSRMWVEGYGYGIAQDTGGLIKGQIIDLFMENEQECWRWGRRRVNVYILE